MNVLISIVFLITSILQIILFFMIWQMTSNIAEIRNALNIILYKKLPIKKRKDVLINQVYEKLNKASIVRQMESKEAISEKVKNGIEVHKEFTQDLFEMYNISHEYTLDQLKEDVTNRFSGYFAK